MSNLRLEIQREPFFKKFKLIVQDIEDKLELEKSRAEAQQLHAGRTARSIYGKKIYSPKSLMDAVMVELSYRARLTEIRANLGVQVSLLNKAIDAARKYIISDYNDDLNDSFKTEAQRKAFLDRVVNKALLIKADIDLTIEMLDFLIKDIDQASFHLRTVLETMKLLDSSKGKVV